MTMLDTMRRHRSWLKWSLALVVLAFIALYMPDFFGAGTSPTGLAAPGTEVARVGDRGITVADFQRVYNAQMQAYRNAYGANMNDQLLKQLGLDRQILQQLVDEEAALAEAERLGLSASDAEVRERILGRRLQGPGAQFVGETSKLILRSQNPPLSTRDFEENIRKSIVLDKLRDAITGWISVTDAEVDTEFRARNEKVKVQLVTLNTAAFTAGLQATDAEAATYFDANKTEFRIGEKKKIKFASIDVQKMRDAVVVSPQDVERNYTRTSSSDARAGARQPHPPQDRGQGRGGRARAGRAGARAGQGAGRRLRRARDEVLGRRSVQGQGRRSRPVRPRPDGARVRAGGVRAGAWHDERPGQDVVRLPHHQGGREAGRRHAGAQRGQRADHRTDQVGSARRRRPRASARRSAVR
jgi:hypothetical protein